MNRSIEAFIPSSAFTGVPFSPDLRNNTQSSRRRMHAFCMAKNKRSSTPGSDNPTSPSSNSKFAGLAAGPGQPSGTAPSSIRRKKPEEDKKDVNKIDKSAQTSEASAESATPRVTRALGSKKLRQSPIYKKKSAAEFLAEGVEDDNDDNAFAEADIRFGIDDDLDPFKLDEEKEEELKRKAEEEGDLARVGKGSDVTGDGGVTKVLKAVGQGKILTKGAKVVVEYTGKLEDGTIFDSTKNREGGFEFELGTGKVIKGWEAGVATMRKGEIAEFNITPNYAYGRRGMPPVIPGNSSLTFEIEVKNFIGGEDEDIKKVSDYNPDIARTPEEIARQYDARLETQAERRKSMSLLDRFYIISPFASQTGERPPWWVNPNITSVLVLLFTAIGFYFVLKSGAIHIGYVDQPVDVNIFK